MKKNSVKKLNTILNAYILIGILLWILASVLIFTPIVPQVWYTFNSEATENELKSLTNNVNLDIQEYNEPTPVEPVKNLLPTLDKSLPEKNTLFIKEIGVSSTIFDGKDYKSALQNGPWIVNDFGTPPKNDPPIIIASHRWGGIGWTKTERDRKSFYRLTELKNGDIIEIVWKQRLYKYKVYKTTESNKVTNYDADLILYTCKMYWESPIRIFKYAKRIN